MVSIIIPTFNARTYIDGLISSLRKQSIKSETTVVDSSSTDDSSEIATQHGVRLLKISRNGFNHGHTRNLGAQHVKKDILVFLTQDALPTDDYCLENLIKPLEDPQIIASFGRQVPRSDASPTEKFTRLFNYPETPAIK